MYEELVRRSVGSFTNQGALRMRLMSIYEVDCVCGAKVSMIGKNATCEKCGRSIEIESWQIRHTLTPAGLLIENSPTKSGERGESTGEVSS